MTERGERRAETNTVAAYLALCGAPKAAGDREALSAKRAELQRRVATAATPIERLRLVQQRVDLDDAINRLVAQERRPEIEAAFIKVAAGWCDRNGISARALREVGVPADVLRQAGL